MEEHVKDNSGLVQFIIEFEPYDSRMEFRAKEATSWSKENEPIDSELYIEGLIKWDGCSHFSFGEDGDGYIHLCGRGCFENHKLIIDALWDLASKVIANWNP